MVASGTGGFELHALWPKPIPYCCDVPSGYPVSDIVPRHVELFDQKLDFNIIRKIDSMRLDNFEKITKKIDALDNGDPIKVSFVSGNTDPNIHYSDMFYSEETAKNLLKETVS